MIGAALLLLFAAIVAGLAWYVLCLAVGANPITTIQSTTFTAQATWFAQQTSPGATGVAPIVSNTSDIGKMLITGTGGATINQIQQISSTVYTIAGAGSSSIDLSAVITNVVNNSAATFVAVKAISIRLLTSRTTSGNYDSVNGTLASSVTIGNAATPFISQSNSGFLSSAAHTFDLANGMGAAFYVDNATGIAIDGTHKLLKVLNNDAAITAAVVITLMGY